MKLFEMLQAHDNNYKADILIGHELSFWTDEIESMHTIYEMDMDCQISEACFIIVTYKQKVVLALKFCADQLDSSSKSLICCNLLMNETVPTHIVSGSFIEMSKLINYISIKNKKSTIIFSKLILGNIPNYLKGIAKLIDWKYKESMQLDPFSPNKSNQYILITKY